MSAELRQAAWAVLEEWDSPDRSWESLQAPITALRRAYPAVPVPARESGSPGVVISDEALTAAGVAFWDAVETARITTPTGDPASRVPG